MKELTFHIFNEFKNNIRNKLTSEESSTLRYIQDCLTWTPYKRELIEGYCGGYELSLIDGSEFGYGVKFIYNEKQDRFETASPIRHPQVEVITSGDITMYCLRNSLVKYIR